MPTKAVAAWGGKRKSWTRHPSSGQLRRETDLPSRGSLSRNCAYRVRHHRATNATPCKRGIGFWDAKIRVRGGDLVIREGGERWIHVVRHLSDNLTTGRLSHPNPLSFLYMYIVTLQSDTSLRRPAVSFRSYIYLSLSLSRLFFSLVWQTDKTIQGLRDRSRAPRVVIFIARNCWVERLSHFSCMINSRIISNFAMCLFSIAIITRVCNLSKKSNV